MYTRSSCKSENFLDLTALLRLTYYLNGFVNNSS